MNPALVELFQYKNEKEYIRLTFIKEDCNHVPHNYLDDPLPFEISCTWHSVDF